MFFLPKERVNSTTGVGCLKKNSSLLEGVFYNQGTTRNSRVLLFLITNRKGQDRLVHVGFNVNCGRQGVKVGCVAFLQIFGIQKKKKLTTVRFTPYENKS